MEHLEIQGITIPRLGLGTFELHGDACRRSVETALELGYRHLDTAESYGNESDVGAALAASGIPRDQVFLVTKVWWENLEYQQVLRHLEGSLERLGTDHVDLALIHWPEPQGDLEPPLAAMQRLREEGRIGLLGVSNFPAPLLQRALEMAPIACNQVEYHPFLSQSALHDLAVRHGHALVAYCPIARGRVADDPVIAEIAAAHGKTAAQVTLRWLLQQENVAAIPRSSREDHLRENLAVFDFTLDPDQMTAIGARERELRLVDPQFAPRWRRRQARE